MRHVLRYVVASLCGAAAALALQAGKPAAAAIAAGVMVYAAWEIRTRGGKQDA